jgi:hypothetical protein
MGPAQGDSEFVAHFSAERPRLHEAKMVTLRHVRVIGNMLGKHARAAKKSERESVTALTRNSTALAETLICPLLLAGSGLLCGKVVGRSGEGLRRRRI